MLVTMYSLGESKGSLCNSQSSTTCKDRLSSPSEAPFSPPPPLEKPLAVGYTAVGVKAIQSERRY